MGPAPRDVQRAVDAPHRSIIGNPIFRDTQGGIVFKIAQLIQFGCQYLSRGQLQGWKEGRNDPLVSRKHHFLVEPSYPG